MRPGPIGLAVGALVGGYVGLVAAVSLLSRETVLAPGQAIRFCGVYLDCHLSAAIEQVRVIPAPGNRARYVVRVRFASDAVRATLPLRDPRAELRDDRGRRLRPVAGPREVRLGPGTSVAADYVFDGPADLIHPRLALSKGSLLERLSEKLLVGDPDSLLHPGVSLAMH